MFRRIVVLLASVLWCACSPPPNPDGGTGGGSGGGGGGGGGTLEPFGVFDLDPSAREAQYIAAAFDPQLERVGVAYYTPAGTETMMGHPDYELKYVEWKQGAVVVAPERVMVTQRLVGVSIAFEPTTGEPVIGHLGGAPGFEMGNSIFWFQSDAVFSRRSNGAWTQTVVATDGNQVPCGNRVSDTGFLVGLWPAIAFDSTGKMYFGYRDGHNGQFPQQDWAGSDVEVWEGGPPPTVGKCAAQGGNNKDAYGGHLRMVMGRDNQPAMIFDQMLGTADTNGTNLFFQRRLADGTWTAPGGSLLGVGNSQTGASLAFDATEGYGIASFDLGNSQLNYLSSTNGSSWNAADPVFGSGSGGWYPSLAMDPINHEPAIAFYVCSSRTNVPETACPAGEDELRITQRVLGIWRETVVDSNGGVLPQLGFFSSGKRVVVYRVPPALTGAVPAANAGAVKIAVER